MRRRKICLAAILAAVMALQTPMMAFAETETENHDNTVNDAQSENGGADDGSEDDGSGSEEPEVKKYGDVVLTDDSDEQIIGAYDNGTTTAGKVTSTVSKPKADEEDGDEYLHPAVEAMNGGTTTVTSVDSQHASAVYVANGTVQVTNDVTASGEAPAIDANTDGTVHVGGNVTSNSSSAIIMDSSATVTVGGDVTGKEGINITITDNTTGKVEVLGKVTATGDQDSAIVILADSEDDAKSKLPQIVVGSFEAQAEDGGLWIGIKSDTTGQDGGAEEFQYEDVDSDTWDEVYDAVYQQILYYIARDKFANATLSVTGADTYNNGYTSNEGKSLTVTIATADGYEVSSVSGTSVVKNADGTYTVVVQRGKGIDINAVISAIVKAQQETSANNSGSVASVIVVPAYAAAQKQFQTAIAAQLKTLPAGGTLTLDMKDCISFNKKTFEILAQRKDVDIQIIYTWKGKKYLVVIPAGYDILSLLDANGYCGCLYLNSVFGSTELTK